MDFLKGANKFVTLLIVILPHACYVTSAAYLISIGEPSHMENKYFWLTQLSLTVLSHDRWINNWKIDILDKSYNKYFFPIKCHNSTISWPCQDRVTNINDKFIEAKRGIFGQWIIYQNKLVICGFKVFGDASPSLWYD